MGTTGRFYRTAGTSGPQLFHDWAKALIMGTLPFPAIINAATIASVSAASSTHTSLKNVRFSASYTRISGFPISEGNQAFIKVTGTEEYGYQVSALTFTVGLADLHSVDTVAGRNVTQRDGVVFRQLNIQRP